MNYFMDVGFTSLGCMPKRRNAGSCGNSKFNFLRNGTITLQNGFTLLQSYQ